ncbi:MAG: phosphoribosylformimino-5-aminoimidazole carboxamide ribotide isomerase [Lachnospiraceae bacterium]|nr:phosphoribosylformimino-5-aminoimidazole carboxamide ribotide isomerase [Lachnospiraceae bacterium]
MEFRPCIDIHNGRVKQIVGGSLQDQGDRATENFVSSQDAAYYATLYREKDLKGGHIILLNSKDSPHYEATRQQALAALMAFPGGMQIGGGITAENAKEYLDAGASHVIVTSYVFRDGQIDFDRLKNLASLTGKDHLVLDLSCRKKQDSSYVIVTDRWQKETKETVTPELLETLSAYCDEFLIHAVDVEGKNRGIEQELVKRLACWEKNPITYAGGVHSYEDLDLLMQVGQGRIHVTVGSALDLFGGTLSFEEICKRMNRTETHKEAKTDT